MKQQRKENILISIAAILCAILGIFLLKWQYPQKAEAKDLPQEAYELLLDSGHINAVQASAILSLIDFTSNFNSTEGSYGYGLMQWTYFRKEALQNFASNKGEETSNFQIQVQFILEELDTNSEYCQLTPHEGYQLDDWENASTPEEATKSLCNLYERSRIPNIQAKVSLAEEYYEKYN